MRGLLALLVLAVGGALAAQLLALVMGPLVLGMLVIGIPWACWQRWKHPERFPDYAKPWTGE